MSQSASPPAARPEAHSIGEAAERLRCSRSHLYVLIDKGLIRRVKVGSRTLIPASEVDRIIEEGTG